MAFPKLLQKLFQNEGAGTLLNEGILPATFVKANVAQSLSDAQKLQACSNIAALSTAAQTFTNAQKQQARTNIGAIAYADLPSSVPTGALAPFAGKTIPDGWLLCNGAAVSRTTYAALFSVISTIWGTGDGSTTFNLPNCNDRFLEGTTDVSKVGTYLEAGLPNITGYTDRILGESQVNNPKPIGAFDRKTTGYSKTLDQSWNYKFGLSFDASSSNATYVNGSGVQPSAIQILIIVKA